MTNIQLYIDGRQADLNGAESAIAITYRFSDLSNPDQITDSFSKTLTLPGTKANNAIFAQGWNLSTDMVPVFNASLRNSFELYANSSLIHSGYIKLNKITLNNRVYFYDVTLYGDVTLYMNALDELTFRDSMKFRFPTGITHMLNPEYVSDSWDDGVNSAAPIVYVPCNNGAYDDFDSGKQLVYNSGSYSIQDLQYTSGSSRYGFEANEWQMSEFRCTKQRPAIPVYEMMNCITRTQLNDLPESADGTPHSSTDGWFSDSFTSENPYCMRSVLTLPMIELPEDTTVQNSDQIEGSFARIKSMKRYNTVAYRLEDGSAGRGLYSVSSTSHESVHANPYGRGMWQMYDMAMAPKVDIFNIFDGSYIGDLSAAGDYLDDNKTYQVVFTVEYLETLRVEPLSRSTWISAGYTGGNTPVNFMPYCAAVAGASGSGMVKTVPFLIVKYGTSSSTVAAMYPYFGGVNYYSSGQRWGRYNSSGTSIDANRTMTGHDMFTKFGAQNGANYWMDTAGSYYSAYNAMVLLPDASGRYLVSYFGYQAANTLASDVPWTNFHETSYVNEDVLDAVSGGTYKFSAPAQYAGSSYLFPARPQQWQYRLNLTGAVLKTAEFSVKLKVWKPMYLCIAAGGHQSLDNARNRINSLVSASDRLDASAMYNVRYDLDVLITSMTRGALPEYCTGNSGSAAVDGYVLTGRGGTANNSLAAAKFKVQDINLSGIIASDSVVVTDDMILDSDTTCKDMLSSFTKMFGLIYDTASGTVMIDGTPHDQTQITIMTRNEYFKNYTIRDWSGKVDWSQAVEIEPVTMSSKWLSIKLNSSGTYYEKKYDNKYGFEYGEARINTGYQFNTETEELMKGTVFSNTVVSSEFNWFYPRSGSSGYTRETVNLAPCAAYFDKDNGAYKAADTRFGFMFDNGMMSAQQTGSGGSQYGGRFVITQDSSLMYSLDGGGKPCWLSQSAMDAGAGSPVVKSQYRYYSTFMDSDPYYGAPFSWDFSKPQENYQGITDAMYPQNCTIYGRYWKRYIEEIYNVRNKKVTMYIYLTPEDMADFSFKDFVKIDGVLYHVNQITDYSPAKIKPVQVELITVQDISAYTDGQDIWGQPVDRNARAVEKARSRDMLRKLPVQDSSSLNA